MPDPLDTLSSPPMLAPPDIRESLALEQARKPGFFQAMDDAVNSEWVSSWAMRQMGGSQITPDPGFVLTEEKLTRYGEGLPTSMLNGFADAVSDEDMLRIRDNLLSVAASRERLAMLGWKGTALKIGANILDPTAIAAGAVSGGLGAASKGGRLAGLMRGGLVGAAEAVSTEAYLFTQDPERGAKDVLYAALGGFVLSGAAGAWSSTGLSQAARNIQKGIELEDAMEAGLRATPNGEAYFGRAGLRTKDGKLVMVMGDDGTWKPISDEIVDMQPPPVDPATLRGMGAASPLTIDRPVDGEAAITKTALDYQLPNIGNYDPPKAGGNFRIDMVGMLGNSESGTMRHAARRLGEDGLIDADGSPSLLSGSEWKSIQAGRTLTQFYRQALPTFNAYAKEISPFARFKPSVRDGFFEEVGRAVRFPKGQYSANPHVNKVADQLRGQFSELLGMAQRHGVNGFSDIPTNGQYIPRVFNQAALSKAIADHGEENVIELLRRSIVDRDGTLTVEKGRRMAKGYLEAVQDLQFGTNVEKSRLFSVDSTELLKDALRNKGKLSDDEIDEILYSIAPRNDGTNLVNRAKRRFELDETAQITTPVGALRFDDLLENNAETLFNLYTNEIVGASAMTEVLRSMARGGDAAPTKAALIKTIEEEYKALGPSHAKQMQIDVSKLDTLMRSLEGRPLGGDGRGAMFAKLLRQFNYVRRGGTFGIAQLPELMNVVAANGVRGMIQDVPVLGQMFNRMADGKLSNEELAFIEDITADGTDRLTHQALARFERGDAGVEAITGPASRRLQQMGRVLSDVSGLAPINTMLQRWAGLAVLRRWQTIAHSGKLPSAKRLASMGLDEPMAKRIIDQIRAHDVAEKGVLGYKAKRLRIENWTDKEAAAAWVASAGKWTRNIIQRNDIGLMSQWMTTDIGRLIIQFRSYAVGAYVKALQQNLQIRDVESWVKLTTPAMLGTLAYAGKTYVDSLGREDAEAFRKKNLSIERLITGGIQRGGATGVLSPFADTAANFFGAEGFFSHARTSGLQNNAIFGNPTFELFDIATRGGIGARALLDDDRDFTQKNWRDYMALIPFQNTWGAKNVIDAIGSRLPRESK